VFLVTAADMAWPAPVVMTRRGCHVRGRWTLLLRN
jgi:hypothetical protein